MSDTRQHVHELIDLLPPAQLSAVEGLLKAMLDSGREDEETDEAEEQAVARSKEWFAHNPGIPFEDVVSELGFTMEQIRFAEEGSAR